MSSPTTFTETFLTRARTNLTTHPHTPIPHLPSLLPNMSHTAIISCADPRVIPEQIFSLQPSDGVPVFRTIAGHPQPVVSGILALDHAIRIDEVIVLHHTDCGSTYFTEEGVKGGLRERCKGCEGEIDGLVFGAVENG